MGRRLAFIILGSTAAHLSWHRAHSSLVSPALLCHWGNSIRCHVIVIITSGSWTPVWVWQSHKTDATLISGRLCFGSTSSFPAAAALSSSRHSPLRRLRGRHHKEEELAVALLPATAFLGLTFFSFSPRAKIFTCVGGYSLLLCSDLSHVQNVGSSSSMCS